MNSSAHRPGVAESATLRIRVLGETAVETSDGAVARAWLSQRPGQLLRFLVCHRGRFVSADEIVEALWPGSAAGAEENVRYLVHSLRRRLEPNRPPRGHSASVQCIRGAYSLGPDVWVDAQDFEDRVSAALTAEREGDDRVALTHINAALELYRGDFIADDLYAEWAMMERERLHDLAEVALWRAINICERCRDLRGALEYARRMANMARYDSAVQRRLIGLCLSCGRRSEAARRYTAFRTRLLREFGEEPDFELGDCGPADGSQTAGAQPRSRGSARSAAS